MRKLICLILISFFTLSCEEGTNPGSVNRFFYLNSDASLPDPNDGLYLNWTDGNRIVFRYILDHPDDVDIQDDELTEIFWIEIPSGVTEFYQNLNTDADVETYYTRMCYCGFSSFQFTELEVSGEKLRNETWEVSFKMKAKADSFDAEFTLQDTGVYYPGQREE